MCVDFHVYRYPISTHYNYIPTTQFDRHRHTCDRHIYKTSNMEFHKKLFWRLTKVNSCLTTISISDRHTHSMEIPKFWIQMMMAHGHECAWRTRSSSSHIILCHIDYRLFPYSICCRRSWTMRCMDKWTLNIGSECYHPSKETPTSNDIYISIQPHSV